MARTEKKPLDYGAQLKRLRTEGPARVYLLRGDEDFLRESFLAELRRTCLSEGTEAFNLRQLRGAALDLPALREAAQAVPFLGGGTLTEVRDFDINRTAGYDADALKALIADVPEWATLAFVFPVGYAPDNRLGAVKALKSAGVEIEFTAPREAELALWLTRRAEALGKRLDGATARYMLWVCGSRMNALIPELLKIAGVSESEEITRADIDAVAKKAPETTIFQLTDALGARQYDRAAGYLAELLADPDEPPQKQLAMISEQFRRLYAARVAQECGKTDDYITECIPELAGRPYPLSLLKKACRGYSLDRLGRAVRACVECDFGMRDGGPEPAQRLKELLLRLAMDR